MLSCSKKKKERKKKIEDSMYCLLLYDGLKVQPLILPALNIISLARTWGIFRSVDGKPTLVLIEINLKIVTFISTTAIFAAFVLTHASAYSLKQLQFSLRVCGAAPFSVKRSYYL